MTKKTIATIGMVAGVGLTLTALFVSNQFKKLKNFKLGFNKIIIEKASLERLKFSFILNFDNRSDLEIVLSSQSYDVYLQDMLVTTIKGDNMQTIYPKSISLLTLNIDLVPKDIIAKIKSIPVASLINPGNLRLKLVSKFMVRFYGRDILIESPPVEGTIKDFLKPKK